MMKKNIRIICIIMSAILAFSLIACGDNGSDKNTDKEDAALFVALVSDIPPATELVLKDGAKITAAELAYAKLSAEARAFDSVVESKVVLTVARNKFNTITVTQDPVAKAFIEKANAVGIVSLGSGLALSEALALFAGLDAAQKNMPVVIAVKADLDEKKAQYDSMLKNAGDEGIATAFISAVEAIGNVTTSAQCKAKIDYARTMYDGLTSAQAAYPGVSAAYSMLTGRETQYAALKAQEDIITSANQFVEGVNALAAKNLVFSDGAAIESLKTDYDNLKDKTIAGVSGARQSLETVEAAYNTLFEATKAFRDSVSNNVAGLVVEATQGCWGIINAAKNLYAGLNNSQKTFSAEAFATLSAKETEFRNIPYGSIGADHAVEYTAFDAVSGTYSANVLFKVLMKNFFGESVKGGVSGYVVKAHGTALSENDNGEFVYTEALPSAPIASASQLSITFNVNGSDLPLYTADIYAPLPSVTNVSVGAMMGSAFTPVVGGNGTYRVLVYRSSETGITNLTVPMHSFNINSAAVLSQQKIARELLDAGMSGSMSVRIALQAVSGTAGRADSYLGSSCFAGPFTLDVSEGAAYTVLPNNLPNAFRPDSASSQAFPLGRDLWNGIYIFQSNSPVDHMKVYIYDKDAATSGAYIGYFIIKNTAPGSSSNKVSFMTPKQNSMADDTAWYTNISGSANADHAMGALTIDRSPLINNVFSVVDPDYSVSKQYKFAYQLFAKTGPAYESFKDGQISAFSIVWSQS